MSTNPQNGFSNEAPSWTVLYYDLPALYKSTASATVQLRDTKHSENYIPIRTETVGKLGGRLLTYIKHIITFTDPNISTTSTNTMQSYKWSPPTNTYYSFKPIHTTTICSITSLSNDGHRHNKMHTDTQDSILTCDVNTHL